MLHFWKNWLVFEKKNIDESNTSRVDTSLTNIEYRSNECFSTVDIEIEDLMLPNEECLKEALFEKSKHSLDQFQKRFSWR